MMTPQATATIYPQTQASEVEAGNRASVRLTILTSGVNASRHRRLRGNVALDHDRATWRADATVGGARNDAYRLPALPQGPSQLQRRWHLTPVTDEHAATVIHLTTPSSRVPTAAQSRHLAVMRQPAHAAQTYTLSLAAQMKAQESPISEQGPPTNNVDSPWINGAPGKARDDS